MQRLLTRIPELLTLCIGMSLLLISPALLAQEVNVVPVSSISGLPSRIGFGSCGHQTKPQPVLHTVVETHPDLFIYLGDNIYGDTKDMEILKAKYAQLNSKPEFQKVRQQIPVLSVWDDHDYGWNDAGKEYAMKEQSREIFFDFWKVPADSPRRQHPGIYGVHRFEEAGKTLQVILLDTRFFRDSLQLNPKEIPAGSGLKNQYQPDPDPSKTLLGQAQWKWLEEQFLQPADVRIVCSSIQFGHEYNGWESWTNLPLEQQKMFDLIQKTKANGVLFISGDVHWGEISLRNKEGLYPIYDVTASGLTEDWHNVEPNKYRVGEAVRENHFGLLNIDWSTADPEITLQIIDKPGTVRIEQKLHASDLIIP